MVAAMQAAHPQLAVAARPSTGPVPVMPAYQPTRTSKWLASITQEHLFLHLAVRQPTRRPALP